MILSVDSNMFTKCIFKILLGSAVLQIKLNYLNIPRVSALPYDAALTY